MWTQSTSVTDRQTDGRTDRQTDRITITKTVQRIASHGKNAEEFYVNKNLKIPKYIYHPNITQTLQTYLNIQIVIFHNVI